MAEPITPKGIQRNATKLAVEDGRAEDLINLRFKDGSWRTAGDGKRVFAMEDLQGEHIYTQLYIHSCSPYHHLLGVENGALYWFANIGNDGETFEEVERQEICNVVGDLFISQTGHLITIIDENDDFEYAVFKIGNNIYSVLNVDTNGRQKDSSLYPFGAVRFNISASKTYKEKDDRGAYNTEGNRVRDDGYYQNKMISLFSKPTEENKFTGSVLAVAAIKLYDGTYTFASTPIFVSPFERVTPIDEKQKYVRGQIPYDAPYEYGDYLVPANELAAYTPDVSDGSSDEGALVSQHIFSKDGVNSRVLFTKYRPTFSGGCKMDRNDYYVSEVKGYDLCCSIEDLSVLIENKDVFSSVCIFITNQVQRYNMEINKGEGEYERGITAPLPFNQNFKAFAYAPNYISDEEFVNKLTRSPFYLLKEYPIKDFVKLFDFEYNPVIDLSGDDDKNILSTLSLQPVLSFESQSRISYLPKVSYSYNGRLHIANYKSYPFHGYPISNYILSNHSVKFEDGALFYGVLKNLTSNDDEYYQFQKTPITINPPQEFRENNIPVVISNIYIDTGGQTPIVVSRYIESPKNGAVTIFPLNQIISYPDSRAVRAKIYIYKEKQEYPSGEVAYIYGVIDIPMNQMRYENMSFAFQENLHPFSVTTFGTTQSFYNIEEIKNITKESFVEEYFPNGLKVSKTENSLFFPVENTYKVGYGTILALCSNAIAVGTGQTGAAPLYVFCTDGIYALYVDASGEMAYTNARIIVRDVCNNAKSVTPIDTGVVFTTDRGLMEIAGDVVNEIGQPAEGDVVDYTEPDWAKPRNVGKNILTKVANLPLNLVDGVDFLRYLTGAIINYNHNERELMVSNPDYPYSYVLDRYSNWSRRDYSADEYVNNYPTSYRVKDGVFYKVDAEQDGLEGKSEAPNDFLYLSNVIKLGSVDFKKAYRFVVRGKFDTNEMRNTSFYSPTSSVVLYDKTQEENIIKTLVNGKPYTIRPKYNDAYRYIYRLTIYDNNNQEIFSGETVNGVIEFTVSNWGNVSFISFEKVDSAYPTHEHVISIENTHVIGCYVFGSYDGRQFAMLGANEKKGTFTDIGCKIERTDVKYFRVGLAGHLSGDSRIDFMEVEGEQSNLTTKLR